MIYEKWKKDVKKIHPREKSIVSDAFFIDLRMGATSVEMVTVTPRNDNYMNEWIPKNGVFTPIWYSMYRASLKKLFVRDWQKRKRKLGLI